MGPDIESGWPLKENLHMDVPKYTQIGNAVLVRLAYEIGKQVARLLKEGAGRK